MTSLVMKERPGLPSKANNERHHSPPPPPSSCIS